MLTYTVDQPRRHRQAFSTLPGCPGGQRRIGTLAHAGDNADSDAAGWASALPCCCSVTSAGEVSTRPSPCWVCWFVAINATLRFVGGGAGTGRFQPHLPAHRLWRLRLWQWLRFPARRPLTLLVSALVTGAVGRIAPPDVHRRLDRAGVRRSAGRRCDCWAGQARNSECGLWRSLPAAKGLLYGAIMNIWFWPLPSARRRCREPGIGMGDGSAATCFAVTSLWWDIGRMAGFRPGGGHRHGGVARAASLPGALCFTYAPAAAEANGCREVDRAAGTRPGAETVAPETRQTSFLQKLGFTNLRAPFSPTGVDSVDRRRSSSS